MSRKGILIGTAGFILVFGVVYLGVGAVMYNMISSVRPGCEAHLESLKNTPSAFTADAYPDIQTDLTAYAMPGYQSVSFPSREDSLTISAWYVPAAEATGDSAPAVILVHGLNDCKRSPFILLPAGMLYRAGFSVLMIDLRDHGESQFEDGRFAGGTEEYRDVLGAWDWLVNEQQIPPERIGLFGTSLGAATVLMAMGEETRVAAVWEDSSYADIQVAIEAELARFGVPQFFEPAGILMGKLLAGDDLTARSPLAAVQQLNGRALFITHGDSDTRLSVQYATDLADAARAQGVQIEPWIIPGSKHIMAMYDATAEYEEKLVAFFSDHLASGT